MPDTNEPKTIDLTPTWTEMARIMAMILESGSEEGKKIMRGELARMAAAADAYQAINKTLTDEQKSITRPIIARALSN